MYNIIIMGIIEDYLSFTLKYKNEYGEKTIVLMQVGSFFEVYGVIEEDGSYSGSSIADFSRINEMLIANKTNTLYKGKQVVMAGFGLTVLEKNIKKLQDEGYTIAVFEQDIQGKNTTRSLVEIISPGTYFGNDNQVVSNCTMCIWLHKSSATKISSEKLIVGVSNVDIYTGRVSISQFELENFHNPCTYDELERLVAINRPSECILVTNVDMSTANEVMQFVGLDQVKRHTTDLSSGSQLSEEAKNAEKQVYQYEVFGRFFPNHEDSLIGLLQDHFVAIQSLTLLLDFVYRHSPYLVTKLSFPEIQTSQQRLTLANHTLKQLNIIDDTRHSGKLRSVSALLNNCSTVMGKRSFSHLLCNPITDSEKLTRAYDITDHILNKSGEWEDYRCTLSKVCDLEKLARKIVMKRAMPKDLAMLGDDLRRAEDLYCQVKKDSYLLDYVHQTDSRPIDGLSQVVLSQLEETLDLEACSHIDDLSPDRLILNTASNQFIRKGIDDNIDNMRTSGLNGREILDTLRKYLCSHLSDEKLRGGDPIKLHETAKQIPTLQLTQRRSVILKTCIKKHLDRQGESIIPLIIKGFDGETVFNFDITSLNYIPAGNSKTVCIVTSEQIENVCKGLQTTKDKLVQSYITFYNNYISNFQKLLPEIEAITSFLTLIDLEQCRCYTANKFNYCKPTIITKSKAYFDAEGLRHPLIEHLQTREIYVTNDLSMGDNQDGLLLYGTNAVGKTSLIKSIGIAVIMAQAGLYVPCKKFTFSPYNHIFTRILGADNIFKGLSTFAVEMSELRAILNQSDKNSLILGDELCSGTESDSALSIFTAGLEVLHERQCTFLFATHFHEVCRYEEVTKLNRLVAMHMEVTYDNVKGILVYDRKLKEGAGDSMYGLEVCKSLDLNSDFLSRAHDLRIKYNPATSNALGLNTSRYSSSKLKKGICEMCKKSPAEDIHHLAHQADAAKHNQYIDTFHKNHPANLMSICERCHNKIHESDIQHRRIKTTAGYTVVHR